MDRDTIIRMAREAGLEILSLDGEDEVGCGDGYHIQTDLIERFAALVAAAEREVCAHKANIALLGADRGLANRVNQAIRNRT